VQRQLRNEDDNFSAANRGDPMVGRCCKCKCGWIVGIRWWGLDGRTGVVANAGPGLGCMRNYCRKALILRE
jgi:hypothetical protein